MKIASTLQGDYLYFEKVFHYYIRLTHWLLQSLLSPAFKIALGHGLIVRSNRHLLIDNSSDFTKFLVVMVITIYVQKDTLV